MNINKIKRSSLILILAFCSFLLLNIFLQNSTHKLKEESTDIHIQTNTPEQFGAKGDGITDDTKAIQKAIDSLSNSAGTLYLTAGKVYRTTDTIKSNSDINIVSTDSNLKSTIFLDSIDRTKPVLDFTGTVKYTQSIKNKELNAQDTVIELQHSNEIDINDLLLIESNQPWYYDSRIGNGDLHKGELHRIRGITESSGILLDHPIWGHYSKNEKIKVSIIKPIISTIKGIIIERPQSSNNTIGIKLKYCMDCTIENVEVKNSTNIGIFLVIIIKLQLKNHWLKELITKQQAMEFKHMEALLR